MLGITEILILTFLCIIFLLAYLISFWKIFNRVCYPGWASLIMLVPLLNIVALLFVAFSKWPIENKN